MRNKNPLFFSYDEVQYLLDPYAYLGRLVFDRPRASYARRRIAQSSFLQRLLPLINNRANRLARRYALTSDTARHLAIMEMAGLHTSTDWFAEPVYRNVRLPGEYLNRHPRINATHFICVDEDEDLWAHRSVAFECQHCSQGALREDSNVVHVSLLRTQNWCQTCTDDETFVCDISGMICSSDDLSAGDTTGGSVICIEYAQSSGWYQTEDGEWTDDPDELYSDTIPDYHSARRPSFKTPRTFASHDQRTYGIELEVHFPSDDERMQFFRDNFEDNGLSNCGNFSAERDGSLDDECGLEIIGRPFMLSEYYADDNPWAQMCKKLYDYDAVGWQMREGYGMHVNVDVRSLGMTENEAYSNEAMLKQRMAAVNAMLVNNRELTAKLAGRHLPYEASVPTIIHQGTLKAKKLQSLRDSAEQMNSRYVFAARKNVTVMEVRIFGSNVRYAGIRRNIEYVDSLLAYTQLSNTQLFGDMTFSTYWRWLRSPENLRRWPYLAAYLDPKVTPFNHEIKRAAR